MITVIQGDGYYHADSNINSQYDLLMINADKYYMHSWVMYSYVPVTHA